VHRPLDQNGEDGGAHVAALGTTERPEAVAMRSVRAVVMEAGLVRTLPEWRGVRTARVPGFGGMMSAW
jgi:hypothetical protein